MARFNRKVSLDISEEMLERIDTFKESDESYSDFHRLALINEIIRRSGQTNFHRPHSLPPLIPEDVPTRKRKIGIGNMPLNRADGSPIYEDDPDANQLALPQDRTRPIVVEQKIFFHPSRPGQEL